MASAIFRGICSIVAGLALAIVLIIGLELVSNVVHPFPPDFKGTKEEVCAHVERYPDWFLGVVVAAWGLTTWISTWVTGRIGNRGCAVLVGLALLAGVIFNMSMLPYPSWFEVANGVVFPVAIVAGVLAARRPKTDNAEPGNHVAPA
jgi:hypothetical protein